MMQACAYHVNVAYLCSALYRYILSCGRHKSCVNSYYLFSHQIQMFFAILTAVL